MLQSQVSNEYKICKRQSPAKFLRTLCKLGLGAICIALEMLVFLGNLGLLVLEGRLVKPDITGLVGMFKDGHLVVLFKHLPARDIWANLQIWQSLSQTLP